MYCCMTRRSRRAAREAAAVATAVNEPQPTIAQPAPQSEIYGYYAPPSTGVGAGGGGGKTEQEAASREVYGYFAPNVAPRTGDVVVARPGPGS